MEPGGKLSELLRQVQRRQRWNVIAAAACDAAAVALAGLVALLVAGTEVLAWHWPVILLAAGSAWGLYRGRKRIPSPYRLLQSIDRRLELADGLSTAYYFSRSRACARGSDRARQAQRQSAEALAGQIDPRRAVPIEAPRRLSLAALLLAAAGALLAARYGSERSLDLTSPISPALAEAVRFSFEQARLGQSPEPEQDPQAPAAEERPSASESRRNDREPAQRSREDGSETPGVESARIHDERRADENSSDGWQADAGRNSRPEAPNPGGESPPPPEQAAAEQDQRAGAPEPESDLIRKLEDAFANLLAKLKIPPLAGEGRRTSERSVAERSDPESREGRTSRQTPGAPEGEGRPSADPQGRQASEAARQVQAGKGEVSEQSSGHPGQDQAQSGIGTKDGAKELKARQQAEAMGKLSEILGRRAENITGEVMIEVSSGGQDLETPYSEQPSGHRQAGGQIHRDEVPLVYHEYLQRYFEQVHRTALK